VVAIAAGYYYSLALRNDGTVVAWGNNNSRPQACGQSIIPAGVYKLTARAINNYDRLMTASIPVTIIITNAPQTVSISSPANGAVVPAPGSSANVTINATAADSDGTIAKVAFYLDGQPVGIPVLALPYSVTASKVAVGTHQLTAQATDNSGATTVSAKVSIIVHTP
jgi:hypothetical protein